MTNKAYPHPYGSTVIPPINSDRDAIPGVGDPPSNLHHIIPGAVGVAGNHLRAASSTQAPVSATPSPIAAALDDFVTKIADVVAERAVKKIQAYMESIGERMFETLPSNEELCAAADRAREDRVSQVIGPTSTPVLHPLMTPPLSPQAQYLRGIGGPLIHGMAASYGATPIGSGRGESDNEFRAIRSAVQIAGGPRSVLSDELREERKQILSQFLLLLQDRLSLIEIDASHTHGFVMFRLAAAPRIHVELRINQIPTETTEPLILGIRFYDRGHDTHCNDKTLLANRTVSVEEAERLIGLVIDGAAHAG